MTSVSGALYGSKTLVYNDDNRLTSMTYGGVTDLYYYKYTGERYRARLGGTYRRYLYNGERVLEELSDGGTMQARYTTEDDSYYGAWLHLYRTSGTLSRFPMYDNIGSARGLLDASGTATDWYELDTFGRQVSTSGTTPNPYRFGGAWGYITDPSGFLQLGTRFYWPEVGRFVSRDPIGEEVDWYAYVENNPLTDTDPEGLRGTARHCEGLRKQIRDRVRKIEHDGRKELCPELNKLVGDIVYQCGDHRFDDTYRKDCKPKKPCPKPKPKPPPRNPSPSSPGGGAGGGWHDHRFLGFPHEWPSPPAY